MGRKGWNDTIYQIGGQGAINQFASGGTGNQTFIQVGGEGANVMEIVGGLGTSHIEQYGGSGNNTIEVSAIKGDDFAKLTSNEYAILNNYKGDCICNS